MGFLFTLLTTVVVIAGDTILKFAANDGRPALSNLVFAGMGIYAMSAMFWFYAMRHITLAQAGVIYSMLTLLALCLVGVVWFEEKLYYREFAGIICALAAMILMVRVT